MSTGTILAVIVAAAVLAFLVYAVVVAPRALRVTRLEVPIAGLAPAFEGYTLAVLTDPHHGWPGSTSLLKRAAALAREASPDLVALLGDYGLSFEHWRHASRLLYPPSMRALAPIFRSLSARDGVVAVLGNHDYYYDGPAVASWLTSLGIRVLINDRVVIRRDGACLAVSGVDDAETGTVDPLGGLAGLPEGVPRIMLSHHPDAVLKLVPEARVDLMLAGHTHGGQVVLPIYGAPIRFSTTCGRLTASGWVPNRRVRLYVSTGVGVQVPLRIGTVPEVVIVRLRGSAAPPPA